MFKLEENFLSDVRLKLGRGAAENVKTDLEPAVYGGVNDMVFVAELLRGTLLDQGSCL